MCELVWQIYPSPGTLIARKIQMKRKVSRASTHPKLEELNKMLKEKTDEIETLKDKIKAKPTTTGAHAMVVSR